MLQNLQQWQFLYVKGCRNGKDEMEKKQEGSTI